MLTQWQQAVVDGIHRHCFRHQTRLVPRSQLIAEELPIIVKDAAASGDTPGQTVSRVLQKLRGPGIGILHHVGRGMDLLLDEPLAVEAEDLPEGSRRCFGTRPTPHQ